MILAGNTLNETCAVSGDPFPFVYWSKDGQEISSGAEMLNNNRTLIVRNTDIPDEGLYKCVAENRAGNDSISFKVEVRGMSYSVVGVFSKKLSQYQTK